MVVNGLVAIVPEANLVSRTRSSGAGARNRASPRAKFAVRYDLRFPLKHPPRVQVDDALDLEFKVSDASRRKPRFRRGLRETIKWSLCKVMNLFLEKSVDPFPNRSEIYIRRGYAPIEPQRALENLRDVSVQLSLSGLGHWIVFGTLLGAVRGNDLIPWDEDTDIAIFEEDVPLILEEAFLLRMERQGFALARWRDTISFIRGGQYVDLYAFKKTILGARKQGKFRVSEKHFATEHINIGGVDLPCPSDSVELLRRWYGPHWRTPIKDFPATSGNKQFWSRLS